jgi:hypothetical protein
VGGVPALALGRVADWEVEQRRGGRFEFGFGPLQSAF